MNHSLPIIDIEPLVSGEGDRQRVAGRIGEACRTHGFFYITGHGVDAALQQRLERMSRQFFEQDEAAKMDIAMKHGGKAWRGYFAVGDELTSGAPDLKEGLYFGQEISRGDPRVTAGLPLHGPNLFPAYPAGFKNTVLAYIEALTRLGHHLMAGLSMSLGLPPAYFAERYTSDPLVLFRIFHYPPAPASRNEPPWGVGEHTDYGVLTILKQDDVGGLQVRSQSEWIEAPPVPGSFVCNIGDMLDRMTRGLYRSTPHRVRNVSDRSRYSFPFFFDPSFDARIQPIDTPEVSAHIPGSEERWDRSDLHGFAGTYGDYLLSKVGQVFPDLRRDVL